MLSRVPRSAAVLLSSVMLVSIPVSQAQAWDAEGWETTLEAGASLTTGNTESATASGRIRAEHTAELWRNRLRGDALFTEEDRETTGQRYVAGYQLDRRLAEHDYVFGALRYERDRFSSYDYQASQTVGYGRRLVHRERLRLDGEIGVGARQARLAESGESDTDAVGRIGGNLRWDISESARLTDELLIISGRDNTEVENILALTADMTDRMALRTSFTVKHNTDVEPGKKNTDTISEVSLVWRFR
ncbi:YdiY family protein [Thioalkalivibrio sp. ALE19]|uniref:DUF481 domain-containing protein n=1 Tax=Thioalkalivibrio sp. ALE19 TaxID=1266909 RepID=UPI000428EBA2|nr:DUF481 domain-containing protein [Thioalkalivibrio sp. ALE19]